MRSGSVAPITYLDIRPGRFPHLHLALETIQWADATRNKDFLRLLEMADRRQADRSAQETEDYVEEWFPDYYKDLCRFQSMMGYGKVTDKYFDMSLTS